MTPKQEKQRDCDLLHTCNIRSRTLDDIKLNVAFEYRLLMFIAEPEGFGDLALVQLAHNDTTPFVVYRVNTDTRHCANGMYCTTLAEAFEDITYRAKIFQK